MILNDLEWCFCGSRESLIQVFELAVQVKDIEGDLVECGIASGSGIAAMKRACPDKMVWGYDSFQGIQLAGPQDTAQPGIGKIEHDTNVPLGQLLYSSGVTVCPRDWVDAQLKGWGFKPEDFTLVEGWVQHTIPEGVETHEQNKIALLRLDMDIYDPTLFALQRLWDSISKGGILIIDDTDLDGVNKACRDFFSEIEYKPNWITGKFNPMYLIK